MLLIFTPRSIEGYPFIIRFKTIIKECLNTEVLRIEGYPFIIRFKTYQPILLAGCHILVLKVIHL